MTPPWRLTEPGLAHAEQSLIEMERWLDEQNQTPSYRLGTGGDRHG